MRQLLLVDLPPALPDGTIHDLARRLEQAVAGKFGFKWERVGFIASGASQVEFTSLRHKAAAQRFAFRFDNGFPDEVMRLSFVVSCPQGVSVFVADAGDPSAGDAFADDDDAPAPCAADTSASAIDLPAVKVLGSLSIPLDNSRTLRIEHTGDGMVRAVTERKDLLGNSVTGVMCFETVARFEAVIWPEPKAVKGKADDSDE